MVDSYLRLGQYSTALYWADKLASLGEGSGAVQVLLLIIIVYLLHCNVTVYLLHLNMTVYLLHCNMTVYLLHCNMTSLFTAL